MIGWLEGNLIDKENPGKVLILTSGGVGYEVDISLHTYNNLITQPNPVKLFIQTVVREDAFLLYGFADKLERTLFKGLLKVNGIGPKLALIILSNCLPEELIYFITHNKTQQLTQIPGIGKKTAERLSIEMKDFVSQLTESSISSAKILQSSVQEEAIYALEALGYSFKEAKKMVMKVDDGQKTSQQLIKNALQSLTLKSL